MSLGKLGKKKLPAAEVLEAMRDLKTGDARWKEGRTWSLVYYAGEEVSELTREAYAMFMAENGLSPLAFPSLRRFEAEVCAMAADLFGNPQAAGTLTSGGTESLLMAVKTARDYARAARGISEPEMILPQTAHPALDKAAHYFGVKAIRTPVGLDYRADARAMAERIGPNTVMLVGSAPAYPHGVMDPIGEIAALARSRGLLCHVDACLGGFLLPFARKIRGDLPAFDFSVPGVTSLSADLHKYGYAAKGASVILYETPELRRHQFFTTSEWPGGLYASPSMTGTRPGGAIAAAWAVLKHLGEEGYLELARGILDSTEQLLAGVRAIPGLQILGDPKLSVLAFASDVVDVYALGDAMEAKGWKLDRQQRPASLHLMVTPAHAKVVQPFLEDLRQATAALRRGEPAPEGSAAMYGMAATMLNRGDVESFLLDFLDGLGSL